MTAKEKARELVNGVKNTELGFLIELCANTFAVEYQREAETRTSFGYDSNYKKRCILKEDISGYVISCDTLHECYEQFLGFIFEEIYIRQED